MINLDRMPDGMRYARIGPEEAAALLSEANYPGNRPISPVRVKRWAEAMKSGEWRLSTLEFYRCGDGGPVFLGNGQHRLGGIVESGTTQTFRLTMDTLPDMEAIRTQYQTIDDPAGGRQLRDVLGGSSFEGVGPWRTSKLRSAISLISARFNVTSGGSPMNRLGYGLQMKLMEEWLDAESVFHSLVPSKASMLGRGTHSAPVMAVALVTMRHQKDRAPEFWQRICEDDGLEKGWPEWSANRYCREEAYNKGVSAAYRARYISICWNHWFDGKQLLKVQPQVRLPIIIRGTPYDNAA